MMNQTTDDGRQTTEEGPTTTDEGRQATGEGPRTTDEGRLATAEKQSVRRSSLVSGLYNLGTGQARSFYDLAAATFRGMDMEPNIAFIDMPEDIRDKYQYFTEANMEKLKAAGYSAAFYTLEQGVEDYVRNYLVTFK
jgi:nucleoside-diphosphate-sugar epimerase